MSIHKTLLPLVLAVACTVPAAAAGRQPLPYADYAGEPVNSFTAFRFDDFTVLDPNTVVVWTAMNEAWLIKVWKDCRELNFVEHIGVTSTGSTVTRGDSLLVRGQNCPIDEIRKVDLVRMKKEQAAARAAAKPG